MRYSPSSQIDAPLNIMDNYQESQLGNPKNSSEIFSSMDNSIDSTSMK